MRAARSMIWMAALVLWGGLDGNRGWAQDPAPGGNEATPAAGSTSATGGSCDCASEMQGCQCAHCRGEAAVCPCEEAESVPHFGETRIYVEEEGEVEFEYWLIPEFPREGGETEVETRYEVEFGLPYRFQLSLYAVTHQEGGQGALELDEQKVEARWALADWGKIFANPTLYLEWEAVDQAPDHIEAKILLGGQVAPRWYAGLNLVFEHEMGGEQENAHEVTAGVSYVVADGKFSLGAEAKVEFVNTREDRGDLTTEALLGPSLEFHPLPRMRVNVAPLFGLNDDSPKAKVFLLVGWEF